MHVYKKNFLNQVIARIDFQPINSIKNSLDTEFIKNSIRTISYFRA